MRAHGGALVEGAVVVAVDPDLGDPSPQDRAVSRRDLVDRADLAGGTQSRYCAREDQESNRRRTMSALPMRLVYALRSADEVIHKGSMPCSPFRPAPRAPAPWRRASGSGIVDVVRGGTLR
jgi:hypothetical protein